MTLSPTQRLVLIDELLLYRFRRLSRLLAVVGAVAAPIVERLCEGGCGITRRSAWGSLTPAGRQLHEILMPQIQAISRQILNELPSAGVAHFVAALYPLQARAQFLLAELSLDLSKANRRQGQRDEEKA